MKTGRHTRNKKAGDQEMPVRESGACAWYRLWNELSKSQPVTERMGSTGLGKVGVDMSGILLPPVIILTRST